LQNFSPVIVFMWIFFETIFLPHKSANGN
jgi:cell shape-determining protein MreD